MTPTTVTVKFQLWFDFSFGCCPFACIAHEGRFGTSVGFWFGPLSRFGGEGWGEGVLFRNAELHSVADLDPLTPALSPKAGEGAKPKPYTRAETALVSGRREMSTFAS